MMVLDGNSVGKIEKGIELPKRTGGSGRTGRNKFPTLHYPWKDMEVGDSFLVAGRTTRKVGSAATLAGNRYGMKFTVRAVEGGVRVWRIN
jgi:hypothetical protein